MSSGFGFVGGLRGERPAIARLGRFRAGSASASGDTDGTLAAGFLLVLYTLRAALVRNGAALVEPDEAESWVAVKTGAEAKELPCAGIPEESTATPAAVVGIGPIRPAEIE